MLLKFFLLFVGITLTFAQLTPRKLYRTKNSELINNFNGDDLAIAPFRDPIDGIDYRLPNNTKPLHYDVWLKTDIDKGEFEFTGRVSILIETLEATREITLHYRMLTIFNVTILRSTGSTLQSNVPFELSEDIEFLTIRPTTLLSANTNYIVVINYIGQLRDDSAGFYRYSYTDELGSTKWVATTQFESTDARHAFPCYDEPAIRSTYSIEIQHDSSYNAISNMPEISRTPVDSTNYVTTKFEEIPSIQSYLIAFIVSDFTYAEDVVGTVDQRVFANRQLINAGYAGLALEVSRPILEGFESYLSSSYSLPKMDQAALADFAAGAMENWGLVTYREQYLLFNELTGTTRDRENVIATIAHEFAHQWFGNLISPAWWSFLWLNEGFATLYENHILEVVYPGENWVDTFLIDTVQPVMQTDANPNIRPMSYYVENPDLIDRLFDSVAYSKSGSVLKMFQNAFGDSTWRKGLKAYLDNRGYNYATPEDLYEGIQTAVNEDYPEMERPNVAAIMHTWTSQSGFPYVTVTKNENSLTFEQNRFMYADRNSDTLWWIPINYVVGSNPDFENTKPDFWLRGERSMTLSSTELPKSFTDEDWIVVNIQESAFYRVNYDAYLWRSIILQLNHEDNDYSKIHVLNRAQLIDDSFHLARADLISYNTVFGIIDYLEKEVEYVPWASANRVNSLLNTWISGSSSYASYQQFMRKNIEALYLRLDIDIKPNEPRIDRYARSIAINIACQAAHQLCLDQTNEKLREVILYGGAALAPDVTSVIYCNGMRSADSNLFNAMRNKMIASPSTTERNTIISSMGCVEDPVILTSYLDYAIAPSSPLSNAERSRILTSSLNMGHRSLQTLLEFILNNYEAINSLNYLNLLLTNIATRVSGSLAVDFVSIVDHLESESVLTELLATSYRNDAGTIDSWQTVNIRSIELFFAGEEDTTPPPTIPPTIPPTTVPSGPDADTTSTTTTTDGAANVVVSAVILLFSIFMKYLL